MAASKSSVVRASCSTRKTRLRGHRSLCSGRSLPSRTWTRGFAMRLVPRTHRIRFRLGHSRCWCRGLVALDERSVAHAVPIIIDVRLQRLSNRDPLRMENATTTHDGIDFRLWQMPRQVLRESGAASSFADFRELNTEDHELFRDYGTRKHTTIAAQCSLCHRRTDGPEEALAGFSALRPSSNPRRVTDKGERWRLAETEVARFLAEANKACTPAK